MKVKPIAISEAEIAAARRRGEEADRIEPRAERVDYDARKKRLVLHLRRGALVAIPVDRIKWFAGATSRQLRAVHPSRYGDAIVSDELDMHVSVKGLMRDLVGLTAAASFMGSEGGKAKTPAKVSAARQNGKRGGRPRKKIS